MKQRHNDIKRKILALLMALVMVATCQSAVFANEPAAAEGSDIDTVMLEEGEAFSGELTEEELDEELSEELLEEPSEEVTSGETVPEEAQPEEEQTEEQLTEEQTTGESAPVDVVEETEPAEQTEYLDETEAVEEGAFADGVVETAAADTDWTLPTNGKYYMMLNSNGSVLNIRRAAGEKIGGYDSVQGGCVHDGIGYFSLANRNNPRYAKIVKIRLSTGKVLKVSKPLKIYHANDLTYNTKTDRIIASHAEGDRKRLSIINPTTLKKISTKKIRVNRSCGMTAKECRKYIGFGAVAYNEKHDQYVVRLNKLANLLILDSNFKAVKYVRLSKKMKQTYQGLDSVNDYHLVCVSPKKAGQYNMVAVYSYKGKFLKKIKIRRDLELESLMHDGGTTYFTMYEEGTAQNRAGSVRNGFVLKLGVGDSRYIFPTMPLYGNKVTIRNATIDKWFDSYKQNSVKKFSTGKNSYYPKKVRLVWTIDEGVKADYTVKLSESSKMTNCRVIKTQYQSLRVGNLKSNTKYYWQVISSTKTKTVKSKISTFTTKAGPRTLRVKNVGNLRDIGGWKTSGGGVIRQGLVYRSASLDSIKSGGKKYLKKTLGVKTDFDLRQEGSGLAGEKSPLGSDVNYIHIGKDGGVFNEDANTAAGRKIIAKEMRVFADKDNYPIIVHCRIGRDRTGLVCYLLEALAGMSSKNLVKEYQISFLSKQGCRFMGRIDKDYSQITMIEKMLRSYGKEGDSLQKCTEKYLLKCGLKQKEINSIKKILVRE